MSLRAGSGIRVWVDIEGPETTHSRWQTGIQVDRIVFIILITNTKHRPHQVSYIRIDSVRPKSPADSNGDIPPGSRLWAVDDLPLMGLGPEDVRQYLSQTNEAEFKFEPVHNCKNDTTYNNVR